MQQKKERVRIFALARELNMETKDLLVLCQEHGLDIRNQLSTIEPEQRDQILDLVKRGSAQTPSQAAPAPAPVVATPTRTIVNLDQRKPAPAKASPAAKPEPAPAPVAPLPAAATAPPKPTPAHAAKEPIVAPTPNT